MSAPVTRIPKANVLSLDEIICATVRALRSARQAEVPVLASLIGVSRGSFYNRLNGASQFAASEIGILAQFFKVPVTDFYEGVVRVGPKVLPSINSASIDNPFSSAAPQTYEAAHTAVVTPE